MAPHVLRFPGDMAGFHEASAALHRLLDARRLAGQPRSHVELVFEEIAVNIVRHGRSTDAVEVTVAFDDSEVLLTFEDDGVPFNPVEQPDPELPSSLDEARIGGLGVMLVKRIATRMSYERTPAERNRLTVAVAVTGQ